MMKLRLRDIKELFQDYIASNQGDSNQIHMPLQTLFCPELKLLYCAILCKKILK